MQLTVNLTRRNLSNTLISESFRRGEYSFLDYHKLILSLKARKIIQLHVNHQPILFPVKIKDSGNIYEFLNSFKCI